MNVNGTARNSNNVRIDGAASVFTWLPHHAYYIPPLESIETVNISTTYQVLKSKPADAAFRTDLAKKAADALKSAGADINGSGFKKATVQVTPGGN